MAVDENLNYIVLESTTTVEDNLLQSITTEICREKNKNKTIILCISRAPGSRIESVRDWMEEMF